MVCVRDVGVRRQGRWIIRHVDLDVFPGKLVYLVGANGAGKSTLAKASAELDTPSGPSIVVMALILFMLTRLRPGGC